MGLRLRNYIELTVRLHAAGQSDIYDCLYQICFPNISELNLGNSRKLVNDIDNTRSIHILPSRIVITPLVVLDF